MQTEYVIHKHPIAIRSNTNLVLPVNSIFLRAEFQFGHLQTWWQVPVKQQITEDRILGAYFTGDHLWTGDEVEMKFLSTAVSTEAYLVVHVYEEISKE